MDNLWKSFCEADRECKLLKAEMISDSTDKQSLVDLRNKLAENEVYIFSLLTAFFIRIPYHPTVLLL